jgi:serine/threonine protein kinase
MSHERETVSEREGRLEEAVLCYLKAAEAGTPIDRRAFLARYPDLAAELQAFLVEQDRLDPLLAPLRRRAPAAVTVGGTTDPAAPIEVGRIFNPSPETGLGSRYRPLMFHAKGGLGEVFVARDEELRRDVALKRIQERHRANPESLRRFLLEAEVTARLEHPGVVPVYGLGCDVDGQPCYAMRFIRGETLDEALRRFHESDNQGRDQGERRLALRGLLGHFVAVSKTVAYAHSRGIIHRDLKPSNVMLGPYGETLVVDWGLAKAGVRDQESTISEPARSASEGSEQSFDSGSASAEGTELGRALGTPAYMSPEQAAGRWNEVDPASDIFSLGATLYAVLTGRAPYQGRSHADILEQARRGQFASPRQRKRALPRALDAICLKAMARQPEDRYPTALALAADLETWLADEPVTAYREPLPQRARRWARRHRPLATGLAAMLAAVLVLGGGGAAWLYQQRTAAEREARASLKEAQQALAAEQYPRAQAAAERAVGRLAGGGSPALRQQAEQLLADVAMVRRIEDARLAAVTKKGHFDWQAKDGALAKAFAAYGLDVEALWNTSRWPSVSPARQSAPSWWPPWTIGRRHASGPTRGRRSGCGRWPTAPMATTGGHGCANWWSGVILRLWRRWLARRML